MSYQHFGHRRRPRDGSPRTARTITARPAAPKTTALATNQTGTTNCTGIAPGGSAVSSCRMANILVIGPHPDDQELGMGGTVARLAEQGHNVLLLDMTNGEPTPHGNPQTRA